MLLVTNHAPEAGLAILAGLFLCVVVLTFTFLLSTFHFPR